MKIQMHPVQSDAIAEIGHDATTGVVHVTFRSGTSHRFGPFTKDEFERFKSAPSAGKHFHANIRAKAIR